MDAQINAADGYIILWRAAKDRPEDASYVLIKYMDEDLGNVCFAAAYENGEFIYAYEDDERLHRHVDETRILGWSYFPYDCRG